MPLQLTGVGVQRHDRIGIEIVPGANVGVPIGAWIPHSPISEVQLGIVGAGQPNRSSSGLPGIVFPGLVARLAWAGDRMELPGLLARLSVIGRQEAPNPELASGCPDDYLVLDD